jgi:hypothetical protein
MNAIKLFLSGQAQASRQFQSRTHCENTITMQQLILRRCGAAAPNALAPLSRGSRLCTCRS